MTQATAEKIEIEAPDGTLVPMLDYAMIQNLIWWAEQDKDHLDQIAGMVGNWNQDLWAQVDDDIPEGVTTNAEVMEAIRNGVCGTSFCMAGQAALQYGYRFVYEYDLANPLANDIATAARRNGYAQFAGVVEQRPTGKLKKGKAIYEDVPGAVVQSVSEVARDNMGITSDEAERFFSGGNEIPHLKALANGFAHVRSLPLMFPDEGMIAVHDHSIHNGCDCTHCSDHYEED